MIASAARTNDDSECSKPDSSVHRSDVDSKGNDPRNILRKKSSNKSRRLLNDSPPGEMDDSSAGKHSDSEVDSGCDSETSPQTMEYHQATDKATRIRSGKLNNYSTAMYPVLICPFAIYPSGWVITSSSYPQQVIFAVPTKCPSSTTIVSASPEQFDTWLTCCSVVNRIVNRICSNEIACRPMRLRNNRSIEPGMVSFYLVKNFAAPLEGSDGVAVHKAPHDDDLLLYEFLFPEELCGRLIGKSGANIDSIKRATNTEIIVRTDIVKDCFQVVSVRGRRADILTAITMISDRFPSAHYPNITFEPYSVSEIRKQPATFVIPPFFTKMHRLPDFGTSYVRVSAIVSANHIFVHQLDRSSSFDAFQRCLNRAYRQPDRVPGLALPLATGTICVMPLTEQEWTRVVVRSYDPETELARVFLMDFGSQCTVEAKSLKMLRSDFVVWPGWAIEVLIDGLKPAYSEEMFSPLMSPASSYLYNQVLEVRVLGQAVHGPQVVEAYLTDKTGLTHMVKESLINIGAGLRTRSLKEYACSLIVT